MNQLLFDAIFGLSSKNDFLDSIAIFFATYVTFIAPVVLIYFVLRYSKDARMRFFVAAELVLVGILSKFVFADGLRLFFEHPRPFVAMKIMPLLDVANNVAHSFPSGHAAFHFGIATAICFYSKKWAGWYFAIAIVNGIGRIFVGVHWPFDIAGGALLGIAVALLIHSALKPHLAALKQKIAPA